jgi:hypothetical protein
MRNTAQDFNRKIMNENCRLAGRHWSRCENNTAMNPKDSVCQDVDLIRIAQGTDRWRLLVNLRVP